MDPTEPAAEPAAPPAPVTRLAAAGAPPAEPTAQLPTDPGLAPAPTAPTPTPSADFPLMDGDLVFKAGWSNELGPEYDAYSKQGSKFNSLPHLLKSYGELEKNRGVPGEDASPDAVASFRLANNIPVDLETYTESLTIPEGVDLPEDQIATAAKLGHELNLTSSQLSTLIDFEVKAGAQAAEQQAAAAEAEIDAQFDSLEKGWGTNENVQIAYGNAKSAAEMLNLNFEDPAIGNNATLVGALANLTDRLDEDTIRSIAPSAPSSHGSNGEGWQHKASDIAKNPNNPLYTAYHDPNHAQHEQANKTYDNYSAKATGFRG